MTQPIWIDRIYDYPVERKEIQRPQGKPYYPVQESGILVLHTTESGGIVSPMAHLMTSHYAPHFLIGENRIIQTRPVGVQGAALHDPGNRRAQLQIEVVGFTEPNKKPWMFVESSLKPVVAALAWAHTALGIPLRVPCDWPEDYSDLKNQVWAGNNSRRRAANAGAWNTEKGLWMHMEVPLQGPSWHWDCGALQRRTLIAAAQGLIAAQQVEVTK